VTGAPRKTSTRRLLLGALAVIVVLAAVASVLASHDPDGLTKVSQQQGFAHTGQARHGLLSYGPVAGVVGMVVVLALAAGLTRLARRRTRSTGSQRAED
jgi:ferric-dicitrate binding protein FerR (iron transport regulator)